MHNIQGTPEWLESRRNYIGASEAPIIAGIRKFRTNDGRLKTKYLLWREKVGLETMDCDNHATRFGKDMEQTARDAYIALKGISVAPTIVNHPIHDFIRSSMDGVSEDGKTAVEIKCANKEDHNEAFLGKIPAHYYPQVQHQLACLGLDSMDYFSYHQGQGIIVEVIRDPCYIDQLMKDEIAFWECVTELTEPPLCADDYVDQDEDWADCAEKLWELKEAIKLLEEREKCLEEKLKTLSDGKNSMGGGFAYTNSARKGSIDYALVCKQVEVDLEKYRKPATLTWRLKKWN